MGENITSWTFCFQKYGLCFVSSSTGPNWATKMAPEMPQPKSSHPEQARYHSDHEQGPWGVRAASFECQHLISVTLRVLEKKMVPTNCGRHLFTGQQQFIWATSKVWASRKQNLDFDHMCRTDFRLFRAVFCTVKYRHKVEECASVFCGLLHFQWYFMHL